MSLLDDAKATRSRQGFLGAIDKLLAAHDRADEVLELLHSDVPAGAAARVLSGLGPEISANMVGHWRRLNR